MPAPQPEPPHGTRRRYQWRRQPCRCVKCRTANRVYVYSRREINARTGTERPLFDAPSAPRRTPPPLIA